MLVDGFDIAQPTTDLKKTCLCSYLTLRGLHSNQGRRGSRRSVEQEGKRAVDSVEDTGMFMTSPRALYIQDRFINCLSSCQEYNLQSSTNSRVWA